jgi:catechol 2,3-dioxygenase-like lactoylglutathione lyase family enzyme
VVLELNRDPNTGKRRQKWHGGFRTKRAAERALAEMVDAVNVAATCRSHAKPSLSSPASTVAQGIAERVCSPARGDGMLNDYPVYATIATGDLARARAFYEGILGFSAEMQDPTGGVMYGSGGTRFLLYPSEFAGGPQQTVATWVVDDVEAIVVELGGKGITFEQYDLPGLKTDERGIAETGPFKGAWFKDPDGNILNVGQGPTS